MMAAIHDRHISCREVMEAHLDRIALVNGRVNAIVSLRDRDDLLAEADAA
ncbi:MAG: amidase, partial [Methylobacterium sp.]|nr:amidase [Methylobacterium sp.]